MVSYKKNGGAGTIKCFYVTLKDLINDVAYFGV